MTKELMCKCGIRYQYTGNMYYCSTSCEKRKVWKTDKQINDEIQVSTIRATAKSNGVQIANIYNRKTRYMKSAMARSAIRRRLEFGTNPILIHVNELCLSSKAEKRLTKAGIINLYMLIDSKAMQRMQNGNVGYFWIKEITESLAELGMKPGR